MSKKTKSLELCSYGHRYKEKTHHAHLDSSNRALKFFKGNKAGKLNQPTPLYNGDLKRLVNLLNTDRFGSDFTYYVFKIW